MSSETVGLLAASVFLMIAVVGGGFTVRELSVPTVSTWARCVAGALGLLFAVPFAMNLVGSADAGVTASVAPDRVDAAITPSGAREAVIHQDALPDVSPESLSLVHVEATARSEPPATGDRLTVTFSIENVGDAAVTLDNTFVGAREPGDVWADFGEGNHGAVLQPGEQLTVSSSKVLGAAGTWTFWPCYQVAGGFCPDEWKAFEVSVAP